MKKAIAFGLTALVLLAGAAITVKSLFIFNPEAYLTEVGEKMAVAKSVGLNIEATFTEGKGKPTLISAKGLAVFPANHKLEGKVDSPAGSVQVSEIKSGNYTYIKTPTTEGKWVRLEADDGEGAAKDKLNIQSPLPADLTSIAVAIDSSEISNSVRTLRMTLDWAEFLGSLKESSKQDWEFYSKKVPSAKSASLVLKVDDVTRYPVQSELMVAGSGKTLTVKVDYANWDQKVGTTPPPQAEVLDQDEAERMFDAQRHYKYGLIAYEADDKIGAIDEFAEAVSFQPKNYDYNVWLAKAYVKNGEYAKAEDLAGRAMELDKTKADAFMVASYVNALDDQWKPQRRTQAIKYAQEAVKLNSNSSEAYTALGFAYWLRTWSSLEDPAITLKPTEFQIKEWESEEIKVQNNFYRNRAVVAFQKAMELDPTAPEPILMRGLLLLEDYEPDQKTGYASDSLERASEYIKRVAKLNPSYVEDKLAGSEKGYADESRLTSLVEKYERMKNLSEELTFQGERWDELSGSKAGNKLEEWRLAQRDFVETAYAMMDKSVPAKFRTLDAQIGELISIIKPLL